MSHRVSAALMALAFLLGSLTSLLMVILLALLDVNIHRTAIGIYSLLRLAVVTPLLTLGGLTALTALDARFKGAALLFLVGIILGGLLDFYNLITSYHIPLPAKWLPQDPQAVVYIARASFLTILFSLPVLAYGLGGRLKEAVISLILLLLSPIIRLTTLKVLGIEHFRVALTLNHFISFVVYIMLALVFAWIAYKGLLR